MFAIYNTIWFLSMCTLAHKRLTIHVPDCYENETLKNKLIVEKSNSAKALGAEYTPFSHPDINNGLGFFTQDSAVNWTAGASCAQFKIIYRGFDDLKWGNMDVNPPEGKTQIGQNDSHPFRLKKSCQNFAINRQLFFKVNGKNCTDFVQSKNSSRVIYKGDKEHCELYLPSTIVVNPFSSWFRDMRENSSYPNIQINNSFIRIDWGSAKVFGCTSNTTPIVSVELIHEDGNIISNTTSLDFARQTVIKLTDSEDLRCSDFTLTVTVNISFYEFDKGIWSADLCPSQKKLCFERKLEKGKFTFKDKVVKRTLMVEKENNEIYIDKDHVFHITNNIEAIHCMKWIKVQDTFLNISRKTDLKHITRRRCHEFPQTLLKLYDSHNQTIQTFEDLKYLPSNPTISIKNKTVYVTVPQEEFKNCSFVYLRLNCSSSENKNESSVLNDITSWNFSTDLIKGKRCRVKVSVAESEWPKKTKDLNDRSWSVEFFLPEEELVPLALTVGAPIGSAIVLVVVVILGYLAYKKQLFGYSELIIRDVEGFPMHAVFDKKENIVAEMEFFSSLQFEVTAEFEKLEKFVTDNIVSNRTTDVATSDSNMPRNRYKDIVPYDSHLLTLQSPVGINNSTYINATEIEFDDFGQRIIVGQAPKPNMFEAFWQLIWEQEVTVILAITALEEDGKVKAHQYWPDKPHTNISFYNGIVITFENASFSDDDEIFYFNMSRYGESREVCLIHTLSWVDLGAPKDTKVIKELYYKTTNEQARNPGTLFVHCSAGVGRSGTFVAFYKLVQDFLDEEVNIIDIFKTVYEMRSQRMKMVQKPIQYHYLVRSLKDFISGETSDYYALYQQ